jgi:hypothetical protein
MFRRLLQTFLFASVVSFLCATPIHAAASYKQWRNSLKAAKDALTKRDFEKAQQILEASSADAAELGPESFAENSFTLGRAYIEMSKLNEAVQAVNPALEKIGPNPRKAELQLWRGVLLSIKSWAAYEAKNYDQALADAEASRGLIEGVAGKYHPELSILHAVIAMIYDTRKDYAKAEAAYKAALKLAESRRTVVAQEFGGPEQQTVIYQSGESIVGVLFNRVSLGNLYVKQARYAEAETLLNKALKAAEQDYGKKSKPLVIPLAARARLYQQTNRRKEFDADTQRIYDLAMSGPGLRPYTIYPLWLKLDWDLKEKNGGNQSAQQLMNVYAVQNYDTKSMGQDAMELAVKGGTTDWARATEIQEVMRTAALSKFANDPARSGPLLVEFGLAAESARQTNLARLNFETLLKTQEKAADKNLYIASAGKLADINIAENKPNEALPLLQKVTAALREKYGDDSRVANAMDKEAALLKQLGQSQAASDLEAKANQVRTKAMIKR